MKAWPRRLPRMRCSSNLPGMTKPQFGVNKYSRTMNKTKTKPARLIVAASEQDPDILYATKFWAPDPFIFLQRNGKRTLVLSDLEIDRGRKQADADEFVMFSELEREVQGNSKKTPPYEKCWRIFLESAASDRRLCRQVFRSVTRRNSAQTTSEFGPPTGCTGRSVKPSRTRKST